QHLAAIGDHSPDELRSLRVHRLRLLEIDDVDPVPLAEDEGGHLRVPEAGLMSEVDSRLQHLSHGHAGHEETPVRVEPPRIPLTILRRAARPRPDRKSTRRTPVTFRSRMPSSA